MVDRLSQTEYTSASKQASKQAGNSAFFECSKIFSIYNYALKDTVAICKNRNGIFYYSAECLYP